MVQYVTCPVCEMLLSVTLGTCESCDCWHEVKEFGVCTELSNQAHVLIHTDRSFFCGNWEEKKDELL